MIYEFCLIRDTSKTAEFKINLSLRIPNRTTNTDTIISSEMHVNKFQMKLVLNLIIFLLIYINEVSNEARNILPSKSLDGVHFKGKNLQISIIKDHKKDVYRFG